MIEYSKNKTVDKALVYLARAIEHAPNAFHFTDFEDAGRIIDEEIANQRKQVTTLKELEANREALLAPNK